MLALKRPKHENSFAFLLLPPIQNAFSPECLLSSALHIKAFMSSMDFSISKWFT